MSYTGIWIFSIPHVPKFSFVVLFVHTPDGIDRYIYRVVVWQRTKHVFLYYNGNGSCCNLLNEFDYGNMQKHQQGQVKNNSFYLSRDVNFRTEFSNHWCLAESPLVSRAGSFQGDTIIKMTRRLLENLWARRKFAVWALNFLRLFLHAPTVFVSVKDYSFVGQKVPFILCQGAASILIASF